MFFSSKKTKDRLDLILDIQSSVVRGALMLVRPGSPPRIIWTMSTDIPYRAQGGSAYIIKMGVRAVEETATAAHAYIRDTHGKEPLPDRIDAVHCVLSSPWIVSRARTVSQTFPKETVITKARLGDIIKTERRELSGEGEKGLISMEEKIFDVRLNGYSVSVWEGVSAKNLEVSFAISIAGVRMIERFKEAAKRAAPREEIRFHSSLLLQYTGIGLALPARRPGMSVSGPYVLVHIHGELTDLVVTDGRSCIFFGSHPIGINTIIRKVAHALKISEPTADSLITLHEDGKLDLSNDRRAEKVLADVASGWKNECAKLLALVPAGHLPDTSIMLARTHEGFFVKAMRETSGGMRVITMSADEFEPKVSFDPHAERLRLTILNAIAITSLETL